VATVEKLIDLMADHDLSEIDLHDGDSRIRLRKGGKVVAAPAAVVSNAPAVVSSPAPVAHAQGSPTTSGADNKKYHVISSPTPGTFYAKPGPDDPPYVKVGSKVTPESVVCKIEAMKIFNDIAAECTGTVVEVMVDNAQPVEYGQPLFRVDLS
jgi:acetyl-CoA carboxylase biotin carboxyl carrier protein